MVRKKKEVRDLSANPYTKEELIAMALDQAKSHEFRNLDLLPQPTYKYKVGEPVCIGALHDCKVEQVLEGGKLLLIQFHDKGLSYGRPYDAGLKYGVWTWVRVSPMNTIKDTKVSRRRTIFGFAQSHLSDVISRKYYRGFWTDVKYQRDYVWTMEDNLRLLDSVFNGYDIGKFVFVEHPYPENRVEVLDGKQRLNALIDFFEGRYPYRGYYWNELSFWDRNNFESLLVQFVDLDAERTSVKDRLDIFLSLNTGGVPQTEDHIAKVRAMYEEEIKKNEG